ncbi:MAG: polysaccharide biosynthesis protein [Promethearchaeota archaeon]
MLNNKNILITGGTGTIGLALIQRILKNYSPNVIRIFSRDETKQMQISNILGTFNEGKLRFFIGDIRDKERLALALEDVDIVFHLAALKHVSVCEYNPFEAIKTNIFGLQNLIESCLERNVERVVYTSSDKAASPCNTMGVTKLLGEKLITAANYYKGKRKTILYSIRFGNVLGSRGSLIPLIKTQIKEKKRITLTHREMSRYIMSLDMAIDLILNTMKIAQGGEVFIPKMNAIKIIDLIHVLIQHYAEKYNRVESNIEINEIGMFEGEKLYEELFSFEESERTYEMDNMYIIFPQLTPVYNKIDLKKYENLKKFDNSKPFNSRNERFLSKQEIREFLLKNNII